MAARSNIARRKRPVSQPAVPLPVEDGPAGSTDGGESTSEVGNLVQAGLGELLEEFDSLLLARSDLDSGDRDALRQLFTQAMDDAAGSAASGALDPVSVEDLRVEATQAVETLRSGGSMSDTDASQLIRQFEEAMKPLEQRETQLALEFSRRLQVEGQAKALAWLREQGQPPQSASSLGSPSRDGEASSPLRSEVIESRSRRLRGPPRHV